MLPDVCVCMIIGDSILTCRCDSRRSVLTGSTSELKAHFLCGYKSVTFPRACANASTDTNAHEDQIIDHRLHLYNLYNPCDVIRVVSSWLLRLQIGSAESMNRWVFTRHGHCEEKC